MSRLTLITIRLPLVAVCLLLQGCFTGWSKADRNLFLVFTATHAVDTLQVKDVLENDEWEEINPILKDMTSNQARLAMLATWGLVYYLADYFPKYRTPFISFSLTISVWGVANNFSNGVKIKF